MFHDEKHIKQTKIAKYASNIIRALKIAYKISNKSDLFTRNSAQPHSYQPSHSYTPNWHDREINNNTNTTPNDLRNRLERAANYKKINTNTNSVMKQLKNEILMKISQAIQNVFD